MYMLCSSLVSRRPSGLVICWLCLHVLLSLLAAVVSVSKPQNRLEATTPLWPPTAPLTRWLERVWLSPWERWDAEYFLKIAERGYRTDDGTAQFHPLYPLLGKLVGAIFGGEYWLGLLIVSSACGLAFLLVFERLAALDLPADAARRAALYALHLPPAFILFAPYTESLFLLCAAGMWLAARRGAWLAAGVCGGLAVLTRQQGIFLCLPLAWEWWEASGRDWRAVVKDWRGIAGLALLPLSLLGWLIYRATALADVVWDWREPRTLVYGLLISRSSVQVVPAQNFIPPWRAVAAAFAHLNVPTAVDLSLGAVFLSLLVLGGRHLWCFRRSYFVYAALILLVSFSLHTGTELPYMGLPRHCLLAFPLVLPLAAWGARRWAHWTVLTFGLVGLIALTLFYATHTVWVP